MTRLTTEEEFPHGAEGRSEDRLTGRWCRGVFEATACVEKLSRYENTGLEPEEIMKLAEKWIPVWERLPSSNMPVYATVEYHGGDRSVEEAFWRDGDFVDYHGISLHKIIRAWQPRYIPPPYNEEAKNDKNNYAQQQDVQMEKENIYRLYL